MTKTAGDMTDTGASPSSPTSTQLPDWPLRRPASRRISNPISLRLQTITEGQGPNVPPVPVRSSMRDSGSSWSLHNNDALQPPPSRDGNRNANRAAPPAYEWVPDPNPADANVDGRVPVEGEKLARLRRGGGYVRQSRGGMKRLFLILGALLVIVVGLAVGLGVGLTVGKHRSGGGQQSNPPAGTNSSTGQQNEPFPLGEYSYITALTATNTNCTANPATWRCPPFTTFNPSDPSTNQSSMSIFNWVITKTDSSYATVGSGATSDTGVPANLTISSTNNPFSINFSNEALTYVASSTNSSAARLTFSFTMPKAVVPSSPLNGGDAAVCFFNQTVFAGTLYLSAGRQYPSNGNASSTSVGGFQQWPYAIEIAQSSPGGSNVPACYDFSSGQVGAPITAGLSAQPSSTQCSCDYRNFFLT